MEIYVAPALLTMLFSYALVVLSKGQGRSATDVYLDLIADVPENAHGKAIGTQRSEDRQELNNRENSLEAPEFMQSEEMRIFSVVQRLLPVICSTIAVVSCVASGVRQGRVIVASAMIGGALGVFIASSRKGRARRKYEREVDFYLPVVTERIVMGVQAGLDLLSTLQTITNQQDKEESTRKRKAPDPVVRLLRTVILLTESGVPFERSLRDVAARVRNTGLRHAFLHISLAHKEGGELIMPLRELSDSTQLYYQEKVEEEIARMPVKVTLPLLCTFAGLVLFFITAPIMQVMDITGEAMVGHQQIQD